MIGESDYDVVQAKQQCEQFDEICFRLLEGSGSPLMRISTEEFALRMRKEEPE